MSASHHEINGLLIDMDGTLVDHLETLTRCFQYAVGQLGFPEPSPESVLRSIGGSMPVTIRKFLPEDKVEEGKQLWRKHFDKIHLEGVNVMPGGRALLEFAQSRQIKAAVFTNKTGPHTRAIIEQEGLDSLLSFSLGVEDTPHRKPERAFSEIALQRLGLSADTVAMIGDSPFDIQAAQSVGMTSLCVATGSHSEEELRREKADRVFPDLLALLDWLRSGALRHQTAEAN